VELVEGADGDVVVVSGWSCPIHLRRQKKNPLTMLVSGSRRVEAEQRRRGGSELAIDPNWPIEQCKNACKNVGKNRKKFSSGC